MATGPLVWDKTGERMFETGVSNGILFPMKPDGTYDNGVAWNGLTEIAQNPSGAEPTDLWADNIKYLSLMSTEQFGATINAYTYPEEFASCDGTAKVSTGLYFAQQPRQRFGLVYKTLIGNDVEGDALSYKWHFIWNAIASPSDKTYSTVNDTPDAITFSWTISTVPIPVVLPSGSTAGPFRPIAYAEVDVLKAGGPTARAIDEIEMMLIGSSSQPSEMPTPTALITAFEMGAG